MRELLLSGVVDAALGEVGVEAPEIKPLIPDARNAAFDYFRRTGIYPINHGIVVKNSVLKEDPGIAGELARAFEAAKAEYLKDMQGSEMSSWDKAATDNADGGRRPVPVRHREQPQGAGGDHAIRVRPEDGAAQILGRGAVRAGELTAHRVITGARRARPGSREAALWMGSGCLARALGRPGMTLERCAKLTDV